MVKAEIDINLPKKVDKRTGQTLVNLSGGIASLMKLPEKTLNLIGSTGNTLFCILSAYLHGQAEIIKAKSFVQAQNIRKEYSQAMLAIKVAENLADKEQRGEELPPKIEDTDNLFSIQNAASETTDEDFIKFWAKLYTEEACKPNTVSKKTVNLCKNLDKVVVQALENDIFPYCDEYGFYFGNRNKNIKSLIIAEEYGFIRTSQQRFTSNYIDNFIDAKIGQYYLYIYPGYDYQMYLEGKILTNSALEVRNCLKLQKDINLNDVLPQIKECANHWNIAEKFNPYLKYKNGYSHKFFISEKNKVVYPDEFKGKDIAEIYTNISDNIEYNEEAKQFFIPSKIRLTMYS